MFEVKEYRSINCISYQSYADFKRIWAKQLFTYGKILDYLSTYPEEISILGFDKTMNSSRIDIYQEEWLNTYNKWDERETSFFEPQWVSLKGDEYKFFIDLSDANYPVFYCFYSIIDKDWRRINIFQSINELLFLCDNPKRLIDFKREADFAKSNYYLEKIRILI